MTKHKHTCKDCGKPARYLISRPLVVAEIFGVPPIEWFCLKHMAPALAEETKRTA